MKLPLSSLQCVGVTCLVTLFFAACSRDPGARVDVQTQITALKSPDTNAVEDACIELAKAGAKGAPAVSDLIPLLKHKDEEVRRLAAYALQEIGPGAKAALPALQELLGNEPSRKVQMQVTLTLQSIDPKNAPPAMPNIQ
jgi:HEAT repeat protein